MDDAFELDSFAPPDEVTFKLRKHPGQVFVVDGDPDTGDVAQMLRVEEQIRGSDDEAEVVAAADEGKRILLRLIQERHPDVVELRAGMNEVLIVFSLIMRGASVAQAVAETILAPARSGDGADRSNTADELPRADGDDETVEGAVAAPLRSAKRSSASSSSSDAPDDSLLAIGTA